MKFASFQPYFFPYLGHFHLINLVDKWVVADSLQYIQKGWINRNRILHPVIGWSYINVPVKSHPHDIQIKDVEIDGSQQWKERIIGQLGHYAKQAPYYRSTIQFVESCLAYETGLISELNTCLLKNVCQKLGIRFDFVYETELCIDHPEEYESLSDNICALAQCLGATEFVNPVGGAHLYDPKRFEELGVKLSFNNYIDRIYPTGKYRFEPALSIIDVMMWNSIEEIRHLLGQ
jgi:hypothetical protein